MAWPGAINVLQINLKLKQCLSFTIKIVLINNITTGELMKTNKSKINPS